MVCRFVDVCSIMKSGSRHYDMGLSWSMCGFFLSNRIILQCGHISPRGRRHVQADLKVFLEHSQQSFHKPSSTLALCWIGTSVVHPDPTVYIVFPYQHFFLKFKLRVFPKRGYPQAQIIFCWIFHCKSSTLV